MTIRSISIALVTALTAILAIAGCDSSEDPNLLNPRPPDSTYVRVVNLDPNQPVDAAFASFTFASQTPGYSVSRYRSVLITDRTSLFVTRGSRTSEFSNQQLAPGSRMTYFLIPRDTLVALVTKQTGEIDQSALQARRMGRVIFINAVADSTYIIREGCQSGDTLIGATGFTVASEREVSAGELSLYMVSSTTPEIVTTARLTVASGSVMYLLAAPRNGRTELFILDAESPGGAPLPTAVPETRADADVELLNALADNVPISAHVAGSGTNLVTDLAPLGISPSQSIQACFDAGSDRLVIATSPTDSITTPLRLAVGRRALVAVYDSAARVRTLVLDRSGATPDPGRILIRGVNLSAIKRGLAISIGSGSASGDSANERPFGGLSSGVASGYVQLPEGHYSFILTDDASGEFLSGGFQNLPGGAYTLFIIDKDGRRELRFTRDGDPTPTLTPLETQGNSALFFSMISDAPAVFSFNQMTLAPLPYSYVRTSVIPLSNVSINVNGAPGLGIDGTVGSYTIGATGSSGNVRSIAFTRPVDVLTDNQAGVRFLNAVPDGPELAVHEQDSSGTEVAIIAFGVPSATIMREERKYSFIVTRPGEKTALARVDGVELGAGRRYLLVIGPKRQGDPSSFTYGALWMQE